MIINDTLHILFRRVQPEKVIRSWVDSFTNGEVPKRLCLFSEDASFEKVFVGAIQNEFKHYTVDEARYAFKYAQEYDLGAIGGASDFGVFGLIAKSVEKILTTDSANECLCEYKEALHFRNLTHTIDPTVFVAAYLAKYDIENGIKRTQFSWNPIVRTDNSELHKLLNKGMAENHFHIGGSSNAFLFSWICLMNHFTPERKKEFESETIDGDTLDTVYIGSGVRQDSNYLLVFKAVCIRYYLYMLLRDQAAFPAEKRGLDTGHRCDGDIRENDLKALINLLDLTEEACNMEMDKINGYLEALRKLCEAAEHTGFIPDYALKEEPLAAVVDATDEREALTVSVRNYERRLFRPFAGEQRFLYDLFRAIFTKDQRIEPYMDIIYAYLLIYCRLRGELIQSNSRCGFGNFLKYQDRKDVFTEKHLEYDDMRTGISERIVLENPQVLSFEGRLTPSSSSDKLIKKVSRLIDRGTKSICGVSDYYDEVGFKHINEDKLLKKLKFVIHFPKTAQPISDKEDFEILHPRDSRLREKTLKETSAIIEARNIKPDIMKYVVGIDACSSEIDCRPEVFACAIRKICRHRPQIDTVIEPKLPDIRITYHAGEDFLDLIGGLRAIDEAIKFCNMRSGDRLGHALALGIDCEDWYFGKNHTVVLRAQELLDNFVWLGDCLSRFNISNKAAENEINNVFHSLFRKIYQENQEIGDTILNGVDIIQYKKSMELRGDDPLLYKNNPYRESILFDEAWSCVEPWRLCDDGCIDRERVSKLLYHYYHFNYKMKKESDTIVRYTVPKSIVDSVCAVQEKLQYEIARKGIGIECNPSSNFLIGTFKDYLRHPIFKFNNRGLFPPDDPRFSLKNPHINASINTDDLGIFDTSLENEYAIVAAALENYNSVTGESIPRDNIYLWLDNIRQIGLNQSF